MRGETAIPALARIIESPRIAREHNGKGWAAYHALSILACIRSESSLPALLNSLDPLRHRPYLDWMVAATAGALAGIGTAACDPLESIVTDVTADTLARYTAVQGLYNHAALSASNRTRVEDLLTSVFINDTDQTLRELMMHTLSQLNTPGARILLREHMRSRRAMITADEREFYESRMALDLEWDGIEAALPPAYRFSREGLTEVAAAVAREFIRELAVKGLLEDDVDNVDNVDDLPAPHTQPARQTIKIGRNDPCPCGSGKKYKRCCMGTSKDPAG
jgi:hypothetical protein